MGRPELAANLHTLCDRLRAHLSAPGGPGLAAETPRADKLSRELFLAHSTKPTKFARICQDSQLVSAAEFNRRKGQSLPPDHTDVKMGTSDCVFLYAAPFRFPHTVCGFLFAASLEDERSHDGAASPFDSGGLVHHISFPPEFASPAEFLRQHELPLPEHRDYLRLSMDNLLDQPEGYIEGRAPNGPSCLGLSGGDERMWTHEVRVPKRLALRGSNLRAVFVHKALPATNPAIEELLQWCRTEGVDWVAFDGPSAGDFDTLKRECIYYVGRKLY